MNARALFPFPVLRSRGGLAGPALLLCGIFFVPGPPLGAQAPDVSAAGTAHGAPTPGPLAGLTVRARTTDGRLIEGRVVDHGADALTVLSAYGLETRLGPGEAASLEVRRSSGERAFRNLGLTALGTGVFMGALSWATWERPEPGCWYCDETRGQAAWSGFVLGTIVLGVPIGAIVGISTRHVWEPVESSGLSDGIALYSTIGGSSVGLGVRVPLRERPRRVDLVHAKGPSAQRGPQPAGIPRERGTGAPRGP